MDINFLVGTASIENGSRTVRVSGANASFITAACALFIAGAPTPVEAVSGNLTTITLAQTWQFASLSDVPFVAFNTLEGLASLIRRLRTIVDQSVGISSSFALALTSYESSITIELEGGDDLTITPYAYLARQAHLLISELEQANGLFRELQAAVEDLASSVLAQQSIVDANLQASVAAKNEAVSAKDIALTSVDTATVKSTEALVSANNASHSAASALAAKTSAEGFASSAQGFAATATTQAGLSVSSKNDARDAAMSAEQSMISAESSAAIALASKSAAESLRDQCEAAKTQAQNSQIIATQILEEIEATEVQVESLKAAAQLAASESDISRSNSEYWAGIAQAAAGTVTGAMSYNGDHAASTGSLPPKPSDGSAIYRISAAGNAEGVSFKVNDFIIFDTNSNNWLLLNRNNLEINDILNLQSELTGKASVASVTSINNAQIALSTRVTSAENNIVANSSSIAENTNLISSLTNQLSKIKLLALAGL